MNNTRTRAIIVSAGASLVVLANLLGLLSYQDIASTLSTNPVYGRLLGGAMISLIIFLGTLWVLFFKIKGYSWLFVAGFPAVAIFPYVLLVETIITSIFSGLGQIPLAVLGTIVFAVLTYLLILTANVLNGSMLFGIPLGQAGKAAQFIFSLVSTYVLTAFMFSSDFSLGARIFGLGTFIGFFTFATIWASQISTKELVMSASAIVLTMILAIVVISVWPLPSVYSTLALTVLLYIMLNISLEMREKLNRVIWIEYGLLLGLVLLIMLTNAIWGVNGTLL